MSTSDRNRSSRSERMRKRRRKTRIVRGGLILAALLLLAIILMIVFAKPGKDGQEEPGSSSGEGIVNSQSVEGESTETPVPTETPEPTPEEEPVQISTEGLHSDYALLLRLSDNEILMSKAGTDRMYPASMTKIMTAIVAIENLPNLEEQITVTAEQINPAYELGASMAGFNAGETVTVRDLLYGVLLPSGADACAALADRIAGSEQAFAELMNQKAQELGMENTHFVTASGLHDPNHYTTCYDIAKLLEYAVQNDTFRTIFTSPAYTTTPTEYHPEGIPLHGTMFSQLASPQLDNGGVIEGGKTGFEDAAGRCLASLALIDGEEYILVTGHAADIDEGVPYHIADALYVYNQI